MTQTMFTEEGIHPLIVAERLGLSTESIYMQVWFKRWENGEKKAPVPELPTLPWSPL